MEIIKITWQRFGKDEEPDRLNRTYLNLEQAVAKLEPVLLNFGVKLCFEKQYVPVNGNNGSCKAYKILIDNEPIEKLVNLEVKPPICAKFCGKCKIEVYQGDEIPEHLIVTAVLTKVKEKTLKVFY